MRISDWSSDVCSSDLRLGREAAEDDAVHRADPRAGEHRRRALGNHRHIDGDAVALLDAELLQRVREADDVGEQRGIADRPRLAIGGVGRSEEHTSELQSLMRISYAVFCLKKKKTKKQTKD